MKVQLLYFLDCPNAADTRKLLRRLMLECRVDAPVEEIDTTAPDTPEDLRRWGSPTILIDGLSVDGDQEPGGASCRLYHHDGKAPQGVPPEALIRTAIRRARSQRRE